MELDAPPDRDVQLIMLQATYGKALLTAHQLELRLVSLLQCHAVEHRYPAPLETIKKMTLGILVKTFIDNYDPPDQLVEELENTVFFRNELAHRVSDMIIWRAAEADWHDKVIQELIDMDAIFRDANELLNPYMEHSYRFLGLTKHRFRQIAQRACPGLESVINSYLDGERAGAPS